MKVERDYRVLNEEFSREISPENNSPWIKDRSEPVITTDIDLIGGDIDLPENYIRLFSRDPEYLFTYWQINKELFLIILSTCAFIISVMMNIRI